MLTCRPPLDAVLAALAFGFVAGFWFAIALYWLAGRPRRPRVLVHGQRDAAS